MNPEEEKVAKKKKSSLASSLYKMDSQPPKDQLDDSTVCAGERGTGVGKREIKQKRKVNSSHHSTHWYLEKTTKIKNWKREKNIDTRKHHSLNSESI